MRNASADEAHLVSKQKPVVEHRRGGPKKGAGTVAKKVRLEYVSDDLAPSHPQNYKIGYFATA